MLHILTILAGTHAAVAVMPASPPPPDMPRAVPIQYYYGPPPGYYRGPPAYVPRGLGWYGPGRSYPDRYMRPEEFYGYRRFEYDLRRPNYGPPMGW